MTPSKNDQQIVIQIAALLSELEDPFQMFPIEQVANALAESITDYEELVSATTGIRGDRHERSTQLRIRKIEL